MQVLRQFAACDFTKVQNRPGYLMGMLKRYNNNADTPRGGAGGAPAAAPRRGGGGGAGAGYGGGGSGSLGRRRSASNGHSGDWEGRDRASARERARW